MQVPDQFWLHLQLVDVMDGFGEWWAVRQKFGWWFVYEECIGIVVEDNRYYRICRGIRPTRA